MSQIISVLAGPLFKSVAIVLVANEIRGFVMAAPVLYGIYLAGGTLMAIWIGFCSLAGIGLSVVVPLALSRKFKLLGKASTKPKLAFRL